MTITHQIVEACYSGVFHPFILHQMSQFELLEPQSLFYRATEAAIKIALKAEETREKVKRIIGDGSLPLSDYILIRTDCELMLPMLDRVFQERWNESLVVQIVESSFEVSFNQQVLTSSTLEKAEQWIARCIGLALNHRMPRIRILIKNGMTKEEREKLYDRIKVCFPAKEVGKCSVKCYDVTAIHFEANGSFIKFVGGVCPCPLPVRRL